MRSILFLFILMMSCNNPDQEVNKEQYTDEIIAVEKAFNDMAQDSGLTKAFAAFAAEDAVIKRGGKHIKGREAISKWYQNNSDPNETLIWKPDHVEVSASGDLASTYGGFVLTYLDSTGTKKERNGFFHTVWKRQADGTWKFIWD